MECRGRLIPYHQVSRIRCAGSSLPPTKTKLQPNRRRYRPLIILEAGTAFIRHCSRIRNLSPHTVRAYQLDLARFTEFIGKDSVVAVCGRATIHAYVEHLFGKRKMHAASVKRHLATLRAFFHWIDDEGGITTENPFRDTRFSIRLPRRLPRVIARSDLRRMLTHDFGPSDVSFHHLTAYVAIELLFATGIRVGELAALPDSAVNIEEATIAVVGKGDRERRVFLPDEVASLLRQYRTARARCSLSTGTFLVNGNGSAISPQLIRRLVRKYAEGCAVRDRVTPHMFRHSIATYLLEEGVDIRYVQQLLGHRSISTTEIYTHVADEPLKQRIIERHPRRSVIQLPSVTRE